MAKKEKKKKQAFGYGQKAGWQPILLSFYFPVFISIINL